MARIGKEVTRKSYFVPGQALQSHALVQVCACALPLSSGFASKSLSLTLVNSPAFNTGSLAKIFFCQCLYCMNWWF